MASGTLFNLLTKVEVKTGDCYVPRKTLDEVAKAPCETCYNKDTCKNKLLACRYYSVWVDSRIPNESHSKVPNKDIYKRLFGHQVKPHC